jgi:low affinity Fe/Cu permease
MKKVYQTLERQFEHLTEFATKILGNSISFLVAFCLVLYWWINDVASNASIHQMIGDIIFGTTFLSLFIIQKSFNRYTAVMHLKMNELISSHEPANNSVMNMSAKSEREIVELYKDYIDDQDTLDKELDKALKDLESDK